MSPEARIKPGLDLHRITEKLKSASLNSNPKLTFQVRMRRTSSFNDPSSPSFRYFCIFKLFDAENSSRSSRVSRRWTEAIGISRLWFRRCCHWHQRFKGHRFDQADWQGEDPWRCHRWADARSWHWHTNDFALRHFAYSLGNSRCSKRAQLASTSIGCRKHVRRRSQRNHHKLQGCQDFPWIARLRIRERNRHGNHRQAHPPLVHATTELLVQRIGRTSDPATGETKHFVKNFRVLTVKKFFRKALSHWPLSRSISLANVSLHVADRRCSLELRRRHDWRPITFQSCMARVSLCDKLREHFFPLF